MASTKSELPLFFFSHLHSIQVMLVIAIVIAHVACLVHAEPTKVAQDPASLSTGFELFSRHRSLANYEFSGSSEDKYAIMRTAMQVSHKRFNHLTTLIAAAAGNVSSPVGILSDSGVYSMVLKLGTPMRQFSVIMDTASNLIWVTCAPGLLDQGVPFFDPQNSSSYNNVSCQSSRCHELADGSARLCQDGTCRFAYKYFDNATLRGNFATETLTLNGFDQTMPQQFNNFSFGCALEVRGHTFQGSVGLGRGATSLPSQLANNNVVNKFSYCLVAFYSAANVTSPLIIGAAASLSGAGVQTTPIVQGKPATTFYYVNLQAISVGNVTVDMPTYPTISNGGTILDSGTIFTFVNSAVYPQIETAFLQGVSDLPRVTLRGWNLCFDISNQTSYSVPSLVFHFENAKMILPIDNYMLLVEDNVVCVNLTPTSAPYSDLTVVGNVSQQNFRILYDNAGGLISFVPQRCDGSSSSSSTP